MLNNKNWGKHNVVKVRKKNEKWFYAINRKVAITTVLILLAILVMFIFVQGNCTNSSDWKIIATVNNEPIYVKEFRLEMQRNRAAVYAYFKNKYGIDSHKNFWTGNYSGESPLQVIQKNTLEEQVRIKVQQILFAEKGLQIDIDYKSFIASLQKENRRRAEAVKKNEVIFGPLRYSETEYFNYIFGNLVTNLKEKMSREELSISENELLKIYEKNKEKSYKKPDYLQLQKISVRARNDKLTQKKTIEEIKKRLDSKEDFVEVAESYIHDAGTTVSLTDVISDETTMSQESKTEGNLRLEAEKLIKDEISGIFEENGTFNIIKCIERKDAGYFTFDDEKEPIKSKFIDEKYEKYIDDLVSTAEIVVNKSIYKFIKPEQ